MIIYTPFSPITDNFMEAAIEQILTIREIPFWETFLELLCDGI